MLEQAGRFFVREKYLDPRYQEQMNEWEKNRAIETVKKNVGVAKQIGDATVALEKGNVVKAYAKAVQTGLQIRGEIDELDTSTFPILVFFALLIDFGEIIYPFIGMIPIAGPVIVAIFWSFLKMCSIALFISLIFNGRYVYRFFARKASPIILGLLNLMPLIDSIPFETIAVLLVWKNIAHLRKEKEGEEEEFESRSVPVLQQKTAESIRTANQVQQEINNIEQNLSNPVYQYEKVA